MTAPEISGGRRDGRYNEWGHREPLVAAKEISHTAWAAAASAHGLAPIERDLMYFRELTGAGGYEFVVLSGIMLPARIKLLHNVELHPCFAPSLEGLEPSSAIFAATLRMSGRCEFVYDGWLPLAESGAKGAQLACSQISQSIAMLSSCFPSGSRWMPKYCAFQSGLSSDIAGEDQLVYLQSVSEFVQGLPHRAMESMVQSYGWLSAAANIHDAVPRFLLHIVAIEYLASEVRAGRIAIAGYSKASDPTTREDLAVRVRAVLNEKLPTDPVAAVRAAFRLIDGAATLRCVESVVGAESGIVKTLKASDPSGVTLYQIRSKIIHGGMESLTQSELELIRNNGYRLEQAARHFLAEVVHAAGGPILKHASIERQAPISLSNIVISRRAMYQGPTDMAVIYS